MQNTDIARVGPRTSEIDRLQEAHPKERRRQAPAAGSAEEVQGRVQIGAPLDVDQLRKAAEQVNAMLRAAQIDMDPRQLQFSVDESTKVFVVRIMDGDNELVRQIPPEVVLRNIQNMEAIRGLLFDSEF